ATGFAMAAFLLTWLLREVPLRATAPAEGIGESFASPREDRSDRELERIMSAVASGRMRTEIYGRIVDAAGLDLTSAEAWLLGRVATQGRTGALGPPGTASRGEIALRTARLLERGYRTVALEDDRIELRGAGLRVHGQLVEAGRAELTRLIADAHPPADEVNDVLRRLAASLLADMPKEPAVDGSAGVGAARTSWAAERAAAVAPAGADPYGVGEGGERAAFEAASGTDQEGGPLRAFHTMKAVFQVEGDGRVDPVRGAVDAAPLHAVVR